jgi:hypothetical protein
MFTATKSALRLAVVLGIAITPATAKEPAYRQPPPTALREVSSSGHASVGIAYGLGQITGATAVYSEPKATPFTAFTYSASVQLAPSTSARVLQGEFRFPLFSATPNVSVQIVSSFGAAAAPMQVHAVKIREVVGSSGARETQIIVEAETIFDVPANGVHYASLVVIGVPLTPPKDASTQLFR